MGLQKLSFLKKHLFIHLCKVGFFSCFFFLVLGIVVTCLSLSEGAARVSCMAAGSAQGSSAQQEIRPLKRGTSMYSLCSQLPCPSAAATWQLPRSAIQEVERALSPKKFGGGWGLDQSLENGGVYPI